MSEAVMDAATEPAETPLTPESWGKLECGCSWWGMP